MKKSFSFLFTTKKKINLSPLKPVTFYDFYFQVMTLNPVCENVETAQGVPLTVTGVAQVKIMKNNDLLQTASEQFLGKKEHEIKSTVLQTLEGPLRAILGKA